ncbi:phenylpropionate dioxygenase-like ring-hydroxylating dioxygenase large terminal subunit [Shimia isoporae]|uniref:Phenylpropionate dioxygenase-like ring-hydroxylating dioxygenase large terminal subunit n=1 Tax=Shimia isoporae TaxID=647720 RepID=A0A4R1NMZ2_9RHOB|nr:SRPBCC family protein [Shimia isoporae]TCL09555.1 phenylpropionate dioxygenase-like ring-hydroxylating dioxygenase large terminal subunit [Shimia isoporae]
MDRETELGLIREIIGLAEQKSAFLDAEIAHSPISRYSSPERFEREMALVFRRRPVVAAHSSELESENAFLSKDFLGLPLLLTRDGEGKAHAFLNVCRHRGAKIERETSGCKRVFTCPYHAWSWSNQGVLRAVPQEAQGFPDLPRSERGLRRLPTAEAHGFIWIIANPDAADIPDIDEWLSGLTPDFDWLGLSDHRIAVMETIEINANWKVLIEGGLEAYHFRIAHKTTIGPHFPDNLLTYRQFGPHMRAVLPRNAMPQLGDTPEEDWALRKDANLVYTLMPNTQMLVQQDHFMWFHIEPVSVDKTFFRSATVVPKSAPSTEEMEKHWQTNHRISITALKEDFEIGEEIQAGFASRGNPSHLFGRFEGALNRFNLTVEEMLAS